MKFGVALGALNPHFFLDVTRTDTQAMDAEVPGANIVFIYLFTAEEIGGVEGTLGFGTSSERSNFPANICP